jgi:hypothetical protein
LQARVLYTKSLYLLSEKCLPSLKEASAGLHKTSLLSKQPRALKHSWRRFERLRGRCERLLVALDCASQEYKEVLLEIKKALLFLDTLRPLKKLWESVKGETISLSHIL